MKKFVWVLLLALCLLLAPYVLAKQPPPKGEPSPPPRPSTVPELITEYAGLYNLNEVVLRNTLYCESKLNPKAIGDHGASYGVAQIHLPSHPNISAEEALDPDFAIRWTAQQFSKGNQGMWSCYRLLYT